MKQPPPNAGKGRPKGTLNKTTKTVREAVIAAFDKLGGVTFLVKLGKTHPVEFARLLGRLLPREVSVSGLANTPPPAALSDPSVLAAALALDEVVDAVSHTPGPGAPHAPAVPVGSVPPLHPEAPAVAPNEAVAATEREAVPPADGDDAAAAR